MYKKNKETREEIVERKRLTYYHPYIKPMNGIIVASYIQAIIILFPYLLYTLPPPFLPVATIMSYLYSDYMECIRISHLLIDSFNFPTKLPLPKRQHN